MINRCILESHSQYATEEYDIGTCLFFKGVSLSYLNRVAEAAKIFDMALNSSFAQKIPEQKIQKGKKLRDEQLRLENVREHNRMLCYFSLAKIYQRNGEHLLAVEFFTKSLEVLPLDEGKAFVHFRRAWSNKVRAYASLLGLRNILPSHPDTQIQSNLVLTPTHPTPPPTPFRSSAIPFSSFCTHYLLQHRHLISSSHLLISSLPLISSSHHFISSSHLSILPLALSPFLITPLPFLFLLFRPCPTTTWLVTTSRLPNNWKARTPTSPWNIVVYPSASIWNSRLNLI